MKELWIVKCLKTGIYLPDYCGLSKAEVLSKVYHKAVGEGFKGTATERLEELGWQVIKVKVIESEE